MKIAPVTRLLLVAIALAFGAETLLGSSTDNETLVILGANFAPLVLEHGQWWRLLTSMFLHIGMFHLLLNGFALFQLGTLYEAWTGSARFTVVYFVAGLAGSLASTLFYGFSGGDPVISAGASGAIFGLLGALIALLLRRRDRLMPRARSLLQQLAMWAGLNILLGFTGMSLDNAAHLGGFVSGLALGFVMKPSWEREMEAY